MKAVLKLLAAFAVLHASEAFLALGFPDFTGGIFEEHPFFKPSPCKFRLHETEEQKQECKVQELKEALKQLDFEDQRHDKNIKNFHSQIEAESAKHNKIKEKIEKMKQRLEQETQKHEHLKKSQQGQRLVKSEEIPIEDEDAEKRGKTDEGEGERKVIIKVSLNGIPQKDVHVSRKGNTLVVLGGLSTEEYEHNKGSKKQDKVKKKIEESVTIPRIKEGSLHATVNKDKDELIVSAVVLGENNNFSYSSSSSQAFESSSEKNSNNNRILY